MRGVMVLLAAPACLVSCTSPYGAHAGIFENPGLLRNLAAHIRMETARVRSGCVPRESLQEWSDMADRLCRKEPDYLAKARQAWPQDYDDFFSALGECRAVMGGAELLAPQAPLEQQVQGTPARTGRKAATRRAAPARRISPVPFPSLD